MSQTPKKQDNIINENTLLPISFVLLLLVGAIRTESTAFRSNANEKKISEHDQILKEIRDELKNHSNSLVRLETKAGTLPDPSVQQEVAKDQHDTARN
jgi:hypothetical protein